MADFADPARAGDSPPPQPCSDVADDFAVTSEMPESGFTPPGGEVYDWYVRGRELLARGDAAAAVQVLAHTVAAEPTSHSAREMLARAQFDSRHYAEAAANFAVLVDRDPADHYAQFGLGLSSHRVGDLPGAVEHLALAAAMRPDLPHYARALRSARAAAARA